MDSSIKLFSNDLEGLFLKRPNRFLVQVETARGVVEAHCPNPGRITEFLASGTRFILEKNQGKNRKTGYTCVAVYYNGEVVPLFSLRANRIARELVIPRIFPGIRKIRAEQPLGNSRVDFIVKTATRTIYLEVKACTLIEGGVAMFPDAPSRRAARHVQELAALNYPAEGHVLFVIMNPQAKLFIPNQRTDPVFARILKETEARVTLHAVSVKAWAQGKVQVHDAHIPIALQGVDTEEE